MVLSAVQVGEDWGRRSGCPRAVPCVVEEFNLLDSSRDIRQRAEQPVASLYRMNWLCFRTDGGVDGKEMRLPSPTDRL